MSNTSEFKKTHPIEKRKAEAKRIRDRFVDRIPVIVEKAPKSDVPLIDKKKFLVPCDLTVGQFLYVIRKRISMKSEAALFVFVQQSLLPAGMLMSQVYKENADEDGFLYITYSSEDSFGC